MRNVTIGYQDGCLAPLFVSNLSIAKARAMGIETIWVPDHFMGFVPKWMWKPEICAAAAVIHSGDALYDPVAIMAYAAAAFPGLTVGTSVTDPIRRHPMSLAQSFVTLDHLTEGRAILGIGNGLVENTEPYGFSSKKRVARLEEALEVLHLLFSSEGRPVDYEGTYYNLDGAVFDLPLYAGQAPRIFLGSHMPRMLRLTGRFGDGWLPGQVIGPDEYAARLTIIHGAAEEADRSTENFLATQTMLLVLGDSKAQVIEQALASPYVAYNALGLPSHVWAEEGLEHPYGDNFGGTLEIIPSRTTPEDVQSAQDRMTSSLLERQYYFGSPSEIAKDVAPLVDAGCRHFIFANMGGNFTGRGLADFESMAELADQLRAL
jgi:phthiodiolone/phenolphthiodiolone dimycocerosates ketoreductase